MIVLQATSAVKFVIGYPVRSLSTDKNNLRVFKESRYGATVRHALIFDVGCQAANQSAEISVAVPTSPLITYCC